MKRAGFTMIELIFVIVILGILAAVAIPKLAATRDDAKWSKALSDAATCVADLGSQYTAVGSFDDNYQNDLTCTQFQGGLSLANGTITITSATASAVSVGGTSTSLDGTHTFGGSNVNYN